MIKIFLKADMKFSRCLSYIFKFSKKSAQYIFAFHSAASLW